MTYETARSTRQRNNRVLLRQRKCPLDSVVVKMKTNEGGEKKQITYMGKTMVHCSYKLHLSNKMCEVTLKENVKKMKIIVI